MSDFIGPIYKDKDIENTVHISSYNQCYYPCYYVCEIASESERALGLIASLSIRSVFSDKVIMHEEIFHNKSSIYLSDFRQFKKQQNPVLMTYKNDVFIENMLELVVKNQNPIVSYSSDINLNYRLWLIDNVDYIHTITSLYNTIHRVYLADGHHRTIALRDYYIEKESKDRPERLLVHLVSDRYIHLSGFNKCLYNLSNHSELDFMEKISRYFFVMPVESHHELMKNELGLYLKNTWNVLKLKNEFINLNSLMNSPAILLDSIIFEEILGIENDILENEIVSVVHSEPLEILEYKVDSGLFQVAFYVPSLALNEVFEFCDIKKLLPPNSTCFGPKINNGMVSLQLR